MKTAVKSYLIDKVLMVNVASIGISFMDIEMGLRILALVVSIAYTLMKMSDRKNNN